MTSQTEGPVSNNPNTTAIPIDEGKGLKVYMTKNKTGEHPVYKLHTDDDAGNPFKPSSPDSDYCAFLSKARLLHAAQPPYLRRNYQKLLTRMIGEAIALAIRGDLSQKGSQNTSLDEAN